MPKGGPLNWPDDGGTKVLKAGLFIDGVFFHGGSAYPPFNWTEKPMATVLNTLGNTDVFQRRSLGGDAPVSSPTVEGNFRFSLAHEEDFELFQRTAMKNLPVELWLDLTFYEFWVIDNANASQTTWRTSRRLPYAISGITHTTRPPKAFIDSTAQTIIKTGSPVSGEVLVPEAGGYAELKTPSGISGTYLELRYAAVVYAAISNIRKSYRVTNKLVLRAEVTEVRGNTFTAADGS